MSWLCRIGLHKRIIKYLKVDYAGGKLHTPPMIWKTDYCKRCRVFYILEEVPMTKNNKYLIED